MRPAAHPQELRSCAICRKPGHNLRSCPEATVQDLTDRQLEVLFFGLWNDTGHELGLCLRAVYDAGKGARLGRLARRAARTSLDAKRKREIQVEAEFLKRRFEWALTAIEARHGISRDKFLWRWNRRRAAVPVYELCWLIRNVGKLDSVRTGVIANRDHSSVLLACRMVEKRIAERPELRDELLALAPVGERAAA